MYQDELLNMSATSAFDRWIRFFCEGVRAQAEASAAKIMDLLAFQNSTRRHLCVGTGGTTSRWTWPPISSHPILRATDAKDRYAVSFPAANNAIAKLVELGLLSEITGRTQDRVFRADEVVRILER